MTLFIVLVGIAIFLYIHIKRPNKADKQTVAIAASIDQFYEIFKIKDEKSKSKLVNAGIIYALVNNLFLEVPSSSSYIERIRIYMVFLRKNGFSEAEVGSVKRFLFNSMQENQKLSLKAMAYKDFIEELSESVSLFVESYKNGNPLLETLEDSESRTKLINQNMDKKINMFHLELELVKKHFIDQKGFPKEFSEISK